MMIDLNHKHIAVFRALQLGDLLCSIPAIRAIKNTFPSVSITLIGLPWAKELLTRFPLYFDDFIEFPGYPGLPEQDFRPAAFERFLSRIRAIHFDWVLQMHGNGNIINELLKTFNAKNLAGFKPGNNVSNWQQDTFMPYPNHLPEVRRHLKLIEFLGIPAPDNQLEFPFNALDYPKLFSGLIPQKYICLHPGSRGSWRQCPPVYFALLGDYFAQKGFKIVITGSASELPIADQVARIMNNKPIVTAGLTGLDALAGLIKNAFALITNCTGVSHIAAALKTKSIVISMDGEPQRWAPLNKSRHKTIDWTHKPGFRFVLNAAKKHLLDYDEHNLSFQREKGSIFTDYLIE